MSEATLHAFLDLHYGTGELTELTRRLDVGEDPNGRDANGEAPLHVATRRRRLAAVRLLLERGAEIDARDGGGKTAFAHAARRQFHEVARLLEEKGADTNLQPPDRLAVAVGNDRLDEARTLLRANPELARTGNPEEDRLLADMAGRESLEAVRLLIQAGADLAAPGLDDGTPLHCAAWFGQPQNARLLVEAGAPLEVFDGVHESSPLGWAVHGARYSGGAEPRRAAYVELVQILLDAGASLEYPEALAAGAPPDAYYRRLRSDAVPGVDALLDSAWRSRS